ncbi:MAG: MFS transporter [Hyphomicrobiales bacterium]|nr:MAG: MFS transporter [Hyphomicrobiales bacterium]
MLFPAIVAISLSVPVLVPGALAFDIQRDFDLRPAEIGGVVAVYYLLSALGTQAVMPLATRFSPMAMARVGLFLCTVSALGAAVTGSKIGLVGMCVVSGVANGLATPSANMLIALTVPARRRGLAFGLRVSAVPAAAALTALGAYIVVNSAVGWRAVVIALAAVCGGIFLASYAGKSVSVRPPQQTPEEAQGEGLLSLRILAVGGLLAATACSTLSPFLVEGLIIGGAAPADAALLLGISAWIGVAARVSAGALADRAPRPTRHLTAATGMLLVAACGMTGLGHGHGMPVLATATLLT